MAISTEGILPEWVSVPHTAPQSVADIADSTDTEVEIPANVGAVAIGAEGVELWVGFGGSPASGSRAVIPAGEVGLFSMRTMRGSPYRLLLRSAAGVGSAVVAFGR